MPLLNLPNEILSRIAPDLIGSPLQRPTIGVAICNRRTTATVDRCPQALILTCRTLYNAHYEKWRKNVTLHIPYNDLGFPLTFVKERPFSRIRHVVVAHMPPAQLLRRTSISMYELWELESRKIRCTVEEKLSWEIDALLNLLPALEELEVHYQPTDLVERYCDYHSPGLSYYERIKQPFDKAAGERVRLLSANSEATPYLTVTDFGQIAKWQELLVFDDDDMLLALLQASVAQSSRCWCQNMVS